MSSSHSLGLERLEGSGVLEFQAPESATKQRSCSDKPWLSFRGESRRFDPWDSRECRNKPFLDDKDAV